MAKLRHAEGSNSGTCYKCNLHYLTITDMNEQIELNKGQLLEGKSTGEPIMNILYPCSTFCCLIACPLGDSSTLVLKEKEDV